MLQKMFSCDALSDTPPVIIDILGMTNRLLVSCLAITFYFKGLLLNAATCTPPPKKKGGSLIIIHL